ncbi:MAG: beta strand repeat-containing protein, partial [Immundisolibacter sp.]
DGSANNRLNVEAGNLTLGAGVTVRGGNGVIGSQNFVGGAATLINQGVITSDVAGRTLTLTVNGATQNQNVMRAENGGTLLLQSSVDNTAGLLFADNGSAVRMNGVTVTGGMLDTSGSGRFQANGSSGNFMNGVTLNGLLDLTPAGSIVRIASGGMTVDGRIDIAQGSLLAPQGTQTIGGTGEIVFADATGSNRLNIEAGALTIDSGLTIHGITGVIGAQNFIGGAATLTNNGTIASDGGGTITVNPNGAITNGGLMRAQNGTLAVQRNVGGTGTLQVDPAGVMTLTNGGNTQGRLLMGAAGAALNLSTGNLTINTDYTNAGAGSGDAFNRRAGVSGTGLIVAGGDVAQVITGATVTNGATTNATLTINNVRVGATTYNYQVGNAGTTGPTLRGAIQTSSVNGGNLTDTRLSGVGVTPGNYNAGGPGGNSGDLGVTFTAASAGVLAPLTGQVLNLRSNFENIADQKLNIVLGAGAAAYNAAVGSATSPVVVANQRVGGSNTAAVTVANTAPAGSFSEDLNVTVGGATGAATGTGAITGRLAGTNNTGTGAIAVAVDTSTAGAKTGGVTLNYETAGAVGGVSNGLGTASVGSEVVAVSGNVYRLAQGQTTPVSTSFGNVHVGDNAVQNLTVSNTAVADGFSESLNMTLGAVTGNAYTTSGSGGVTQLAAGASTVPVTLGIDTSTAGAKSGSLTLNYASDGTGTSGLAAIAAGSQTVTVSGAVYRLASANTLGAVNFGNVHVGDTVQQALVITNTALADGYSESLNASFGASSDSRILTSGSISQLAAGATNASSMVVGLDTSAAGSVAGTQVIHFASDGTGTSGLGVTNLASQTIGVTGDITTSGSVFRLASASPAAPNPVNFGNLRIGTVADQALSITNTAIDDGFSESLNASITSNGAPVTASGSFNLLGPTATDSSSLHVGLDTSTAGAKSGTATIALVSDGTGTSGLGLTNLPAQIVAVSGAVYRLASPQLDTPSVVLAARRGDASPTAGVGVTNVSPDAFTEGLNASIGTASAGFSASGAIGNLAAGGSDAATLRVGLDTGTAGATSGSASVDFVSTGAGTTSAADLSVGSAIVGLVGRVYETAVASLTTPTVDFGIVHVGDVVADRTVGVANAAPVAALNDTLKASIATGAAGFGASGSVSGLAAGASDTSSLLVALDTSSAGFYSGSASVAFASSNPDMADLNLGSQSVALAAQVNNYADAALRQAGGFGVLSAVGDVYTLDFGTLVQGSAVRSASLEVLNDVLGPSDLLDGQFGATDTDDFAYLASFFDLFTDLGAGQAQGGFGISFDPVTLGLVSDSVVLNASGHNASGFRGALGPITLHFTARVVAGGTGTVPVPGTLLLLASALVLMASLRRRVTPR